MGGLSYGNAIVGDLVNRDTDGDGLLDWEESLWDTDPNNKDTNGDGVSDSVEIAKIKGLKVSIVPISSGKLSRAAKRPKCSVLINSKLPKLRNWKEAVKDYLANEK